jgi:hypothetical protein
LEAIRSREREREREKMSDSTLLEKLKCISVVLILYFTSTFGSTYMLFPYTILLFINRSLFHTLSDFSLRIWFGLAVVSKFKSFFQTNEN